MRDSGGGGGGGGERHRTHDGSFIYKGNGISNTSPYDTI